MTNEHDRSTGPSGMVGLGRLTTRERMERTSKPEAEYTGRPIVDGAVTVRGGAGDGARTLEVVHETGLDEPADGEDERSGI
jgi:hypothetical protein